jgi:hypothetical protein
MSAVEKLRVVKEYRIGRNDDEGIAATIGDVARCACCDREITRVSVMSNGALMGSECATYLARPDLRQTDEQLRFYFGRRNKKADAYLRENGLQ